MLMLRILQVQRFKMQQADSLWIVIPAYNEGDKISEVIEKAKFFSSNVIVVDDGSRDNTKQIAEREGIVVLSHVVNLGKGAALKTGCDYAVMKGAEKIVVLDADMQHKPEDIPRFLKALEGRDIVFGYRQLDSGSMPSILRFGNKFINKLAFVLFGIKLNDTQCGFRAFTSEAYKKIRWRAADYSMESEMIANAGKQKLNYSEVAIETVYLDRYKGTTVLDGVKIVMNMISWRIR